MLSFLAPVKPLVVCALVFGAIDFVTGVMASRKRAMNRGEPWGFESEKARRTVWKLVCIIGGIVLSWVLDTWIIKDGNLNLARIFTGFVCGVEFWSYLENAAEISGHPAFRLFKKLMKQNYEQRSKKQ